MIEYPVHPAMQYHRRRAYRMGWRAGERNPTVPMEHALRRWIRRWSKRDDGVDLLRCQRDWEDGWRDGSMLGHAF